MPSPFSGERGTVPEHGPCPLNAVPGRKPCALTRSAAGFSKASDNVPFTRPSEEFDPGTRPVGRVVGEARNEVTQEEAKRARKSPTAISCKGNMASCLDVEAIGQGHTGVNTSHSFQPRASSSAEERQGNRADRVTGQDPRLTARHADSSAAPPGPSRQMGKQNGGPEPLHAALALTLRTFPPSTPFIHYPQRPPRDEKERAECGSSPPARFWRDDRMGFGRAAASGRFCGWRRKAGAAVLL
ncbi:hypothetical protein AAFF_G00221140 [Aldrovandia affinis]|uniref:Uncharacterized protein n=1 Tax=Aldrovandia affinis TaxID=143900 RepID=A0AAD7W5B6_9TELE|nr:hypothetical protein AAFF_G00221140 [Aldrovandia affinis]